METADDASIAWQLYNRLSDGSRSDWMDHQAWLLQAVTQLVLLVGEDEIVYAAASYSVELSSARLVVFTNTCVFETVCSEIEDEQGDPRTTVVSRTAIRSLALGGGAPIIFDPENTAKRRSVAAWPGDLVVIVGYDGLDAPVTVSGPGVRSSDRQARGDLVGFLAALKHDLLDKKQTAHN